MRRIITALLLTACLTGCGVLGGGPMPFRTNVAATAPVDCSADRSTIDPACEHVTPEVSTRPPYVLHFAEFDDEGWLFPGVGASGYTPAMGAAHEQIDRTIVDLQRQLARGPVLLMVYVHGWKHSAWFGDSDVQRFREILADAARDDRPTLAATAPARRVVGIYIGWRGNTFPASEPWSNLTFWERKDAAMRVASGSVRELFARIRALRMTWHPDQTPGTSVAEPRLRSIVIGHSFGAQIAFASLLPSILLDLASPTKDVAAWRSNRLRQTTDLTILLNPAFEASAYEPIDRLARQFHLPTDDEPPVLMTVTSTADTATGTYFPIGRYLSTLDQRPFVSDDQQETVLRTPGFIDRYRTHVLAPDPGPVPASCRDWRPRPAEDESPAARGDRGYRNVQLEIVRNREWSTTTGDAPGRQLRWPWTFCGRTTLVQPKNEPHIVWNVQTSKELVPGHNDITGDAFVSFLRQIFLYVMVPPASEVHNER